MLLQATPKTYKIVISDCKWKWIHAYYSGPSISEGSASVDSTNYVSKIFRGEKVSESSQKRNLNLPLLTAIYIAFILYLQLFTIYIVLGTTSNLEIT